MVPLEKISTPTRDPLRAFVAVEVADDYATALQSTFRQGLQTRLEASWQPIPARNYHITLVFLGRIAAQQLPNIESVLELCTNHRPFTAEVSEINYLSPRRGDVLAAIIGSEGALSLASMQSELQASMTNWIERPGNNRFRPHITLARLKKSHRRQPATSLTECLPAAISMRPLAIRSVALFESQLTSEGSIYRALSRVPLAG